ncbi:LLM class flavin-dependent oxidoreductase [Cohnella cholangitidis]|uniref:LLM class flavin-dependent oxidoreductase n=1 Tax=Cohnella cholangitidis TaxID=2598458 RepID=A0A7G5BSR4_9BACL|nr:LLM class flavin-dependent oxidoreductase [Cohnella cholangitidis]QMV39998.1 LLM class flavin-dependent oxidoreductase [Cohnella cholangitidis]
MKLSVLEHSHVNEGRSVKETLAETVALAQETEKLGYTRFWVSEHHGSEALASSSPEILIGHIASHTEKIRVGSGGVMLPHYSAYKVAENFKLLEALHPGRIDVGLGRAPGGMPIATRALQEHKRGDIDQYPQQVVDLNAYLHDNNPANHRFPGLRAFPQTDNVPELWLLGSSDGSAKIAAQLGTAYAFAQFFGAAGDEALQQYFAYFRPSEYNSKPVALAAVMAICADTEEEARQLARSNELFFLKLLSGQELGYMPSVRTATEYPYSPMELQMIEQMKSRRFIGTPGQVKEGLKRYADRLHLDELMIVSHIHDFDKRVRSYRYIAEAFGI